MTLVFATLGAKIKKALSLDDPEKDGRDNARLSARLQAVEAKAEAKASRQRRELTIATAQYRRRGARSR